MKKTLSFLFIVICVMALLPHTSLAQELLTRPMVRLIYFCPRDREPQPDIDQKMDKLIKTVQQAYADRMEIHGFGRKTFLFETDATGKTVVHHVVGRFTDSYYRNLSHTWDIWGEIEERFDLSKNFYLTAIDVSSEALDRGRTGGRGRDLGGTGGLVLIPASGYNFTGSYFNYAIADHELSHAFGLQHDFRPTSNYFCYYEWLNVHRAFNPSQSAVDQPSTTKMLPPSLASPPNAIRLRFEVTDPDGLYQVQLLTTEVGNLRPSDVGGSFRISGGMIGCKRLNGEPNRTIEFVTIELIPENKFVYLRMIDVHGNISSSQDYPIDITSLLPSPGVVSIPDANLAAAVRKEIGNITTRSMLNLTHLYVPNHQITNLTGLEHAHRLAFIDLGSELDEWRWVNSNTVSDFSPLKGLTRLTYLNLNRSSLVNVSFLSDLPLTRLVLWDNAISDVSPLAGLTQLTYLGLSRNPISDVSPLAGLTQLTNLDLSSDTISDVSPLAGLTQLTNLGLSGDTISDVSPLAGLTQLRVLQLGGNAISDVSPLAGLTQLTYLSLVGDTISDVSPLAGLTQLTYLGLSRSAVSDVSALSSLTQLEVLDLSGNAISDVSPLVGLDLPGTQWGSTGLYIERNPLNYASVHTHIPAMQAKGVEVKFDPRTYPALDIISGTGQQAAGGEGLTDPFVVAAIDARGTPMQGVSVNFTVIAGSGELSITNATTDAGGRAQTTLTLGPNPGINRVQATAAALQSSVPFITVAVEAPAPITEDVETPQHIAEDVNEDGVVDVQDLVSVAQQYGQTGTTTADVNDDGVVNIDDLILVAAVLDADAAAPSLHPATLEPLTVLDVKFWLSQARQRDFTDPSVQRGILFLEQLLASLIPKETALLANYPNPFNPETWIPYQLAKPADVTLTIYAVNGQVVRRLALGHQAAGIYQSKSRAAYWDGRNAIGEPVASGVYFYTFTAGDFTATRKMLIRK